MGFNAIPDKILVLSKMKAFADDVAQMVQFFSD